MPIANHRRRRTAGELPAVQQALAPLGERVERHNVVGVLDDTLAIIRDERARRRLALVYPAAVLLLALLGTAWSTLSNGPLMRGVEGSFHEPPPSVAPSPWPRLDPADWSLMSMAFGAVVFLIVWGVRATRDGHGHLASAARCDLLAELASIDGLKQGHNRLADDLLAAIGLTDRPSARRLANVTMASDDIDDRAQGLRALGLFERSLDERRRRRAHRLVPIIGSLVAGIAVLFYGVAIFRPMTRLFESISVPQHVRSGGESR